MKKKKNEINDMNKKKAQNEKKNKKQEGTKCHELKRWCLKGEKKGDEEKRKKKRAKKKIKGQK